MKERLQGLITGVVIGSVATCTIGAFAAQYVANDNPFPVTFNGNRVYLQGYNIDGSTYFKLRDIADIIGGFNVDFQNNTIVLTNDNYQKNYWDRDAFVGKWVRVDSETISLNINSDNSFETFEAGFFEGGGKWEFDNANILFHFSDNSGTLLGNIEDDMLKFVNEEYGISILYKKLQ